MKTDSTIFRLERRLSLLRNRNQKLGFWRSTAFSLFMVLTVAGVIDLFPEVTFSSALASLVVFAFFLFAHRRVRRAQHLFESRLKVALRQKATAELDWKALPPFREPGQVPAWPYLTDLNVVGEQSLFRLADHSISKSGARRLMGLFLSQDVGDGEIERRSRLVRELKDLRFLRHSFLGRLGAERQSVDNAQMEALFSESLSEIKSLWPFLWICFLQICMIVGFFFYANGDDRPFFMIAALLLLFESLRLRGKIHARRAYGWSLTAAVSLEGLRSAVGLLERFSRTPKPELAKVLSVFRPEHSASTRLKQLDRISGALGARQNFIVHGILHLLFPWDLFWTLRLESLRRRIREDLTRWQEALAEFEAFLSLAMLADANGDWTTARLSAKGGPVLDAKDLRHPLIAKGKAVGNPVILDSTEKCVLITGSNMSGKSTFLRSVGLNLLLAKAGSPVAAESFEFRNLPLFTSLSGGDSLQEGLSSFYAEVRRLKDILEFIRREGRALFLIDEIFRGTNNRERLIGSKAYIREIVEKGGTGLVTSHDLELSHLEDLGIGIVNYHFRESIEGTEMTFHFRKERGPCPTTNALRVMSLNGLPVEA